MQIIVNINLSLIYFNVKYSDILKHTIKLSMTPKSLVVIS